MLRSLVVAPLLVCGAAICSPVSAETVVNNDVTSVVSAQVKRAIKKAESGRAVISKPLVMIHKFNWDAIRKIGCEGSLKNNCDVVHKFLAE